MSILAIVELILGIIAIIVGFFVVMGGLVVIEILYYVNGLELQEWQEWTMVLLLPYLLFRFLYYFVSKFRNPSTY